MDPLRVIVPTPKIYWVFIVSGAIIGGITACSAEYSKMKGGVSALPEEGLAQFEEGAQLRGLPPQDQCAILQHLSENAASDSIIYGVRPAECAAYRTYRDKRGPTALVYGLIGCILGLFVGMFVNRRLRDTGKFPNWVG